jgi:DNA-binding GntR family transcriptional regulator
MHADDHSDETLRPAPLTELARRRLETMILSGELTANERLNENILANRFGISRGPLREAIRALHHSGLVEMIAHRGAFVRKIEARDVVEIYHIRAGLERAGARLACENASQTDIDGLKGLVVLMDSAVEEDDFNAYFNLNLEFHTAIHGLSKNQRLIRLYEQLAQELSLFRKHTILKSKMQASNAEHHQILSAFEAGDSEAAACAMEEHVLTSALRLKLVLAPRRQSVQVEKATS